MININAEIYCKKTLIEKEIINPEDINFWGRIEFSNFYQVREIAFKLNQRISKTYLPGKIFSASILTKIFELILLKYEKEINPDSSIRLLIHLEGKHSRTKIHNLIRVYFDSFPSSKILLENQNLDNLVELIENNNNLKLEFIKKILILSLQNQNKAVNDLRVFLEDSEIKSQTIYNEFIDEIENFYQYEKPIPNTEFTLIEFLKFPLTIFPDDIEQQLKFILENWKYLLPAELLNQILATFDLISEDKKLFQFQGGEIVTTVPKFTIEELTGLGDKITFEKLSYHEVETEKFTPDLDWMPEVILLAKNIYVWLYQLSQKYNCEINRLDQIPDEELDLLKSYNFNALWLIGIWERSPASRKIKQLTGNPEALASAYSIYDYVIAQDLGGEEAFQNLDKRCRERGIRLACDMVPNHMGIFSKWILAHPDYFIQTSYSPFPNYSFTGPDLSDDPRIQIRIEDGYWTRKDAAVVFQLIDNATGQIRYIYHGNDGTNMPWNDTAQLNLLKEEVREALIKLIFRVAQKFSIIRLDAAMTLTQKHYQRLWFPIPGTGGAIPSRSDFAMTKEEFLLHYPKEFWRDVVDRFNQYKPDTLLLAEAFWLMEGYFVRTLGMHRVYNSAFMNMLKKEENSKFRELIKNTLEFNPQILKRYVNFLSNPDEETAINQFGDGDKFFGCSVLMVTLPGLPMFAHGQIEGFREKYGHEYRRSYYNELPNEFLIERHKKEIFPLMKKRYLFSQVENFEFYDFKDYSGKVVEDVFVYSNRKGDERVLIFYNNSYNTYSGYIDLTCLKNVGMSDAEDKKRLEKKSLGEALHLKNSQDCFYVFKELRTGLEYIRSGQDWFNNHFEVQLYGYDYKIFSDFIEIYDNSGDLFEFSKSLQNKGVNSIYDKLNEFKTQKYVEKVKTVLNFESVKSIFDNDEIAEEIKFIENFINQIRGIRELGSVNFDILSFDLKLSIDLHKKVIEVLIKLSNLKRRPIWLGEYFKLFSVPVHFDSFHYTILGSYIVELMERHSKVRSEFFDKFTKKLFQVFSKNSVIESTVYISVKKLFDEMIKNDDIKILVTDQKGFMLINMLISQILQDSQLKNFLEAHDFQGQSFFRKEKFELLMKIFQINLLMRFLLISKSDMALKESTDLVSLKRLLRLLFNYNKKIHTLNEKNLYRFDVLLEILVKNKLK